jgi:hypothetical protein
LAQESPEHASGEVAEDGVGAHRQNRGVHGRVGMGRAVPDRVDAAVEAVQASGQRPALNGLVAEAHRDQLARGDQAVLAGGQRRDAPIWGRVDVILGHV